VFQQKLYNSEEKVNGYPVKKIQCIYFLLVRCVSQNSKEFWQLFPAEKNIVYHKIKLNVWWAIKMQICVFIYDKRLRYHGPDFWPQKSTTVIKKEGVVCRITFAFYMTKLQGWHNMLKSWFLFLIKNIHPWSKINTSLSINMQHDITCLTDTKDVVKCLKSWSHSKMAGRCRKTFTARRVTCISILFNRILRISGMPYMPVTKVSGVLLLEHRHCGCESSSARGCCIFYCISIVPCK